MFLNNFSVTIPQGTETAAGYIELKHKTQYTLVLRNAHPMRCDVRVEIDGKHIGTWRIEPQNLIVIERPVHDSGRFTFYKIDTIEAAKAGIDKNDPNTGLIKVTFTPEKQSQYYPFTPNQPMAESEYYPPTPSAQPMNRSSAPGSFSAGGTGLSGQSNQYFSKANEIVYDRSLQTEIYLRLVARNQDEPRPLTAFSTPVPPPIL